ncbi:unnamed protein product (macronuclear) [Paramecium tetraurelia]|uniref:Uncharacterized protein n=1 Tax=Paramecium tetraurelia TaxID=5888 RepID=A0D1F7_PARTE|nr:uncharacterized protein GSPATT00012398001 [Paramecium tetraurelia]CAK76874.1 unnamed protein product [Paramecium tetraurelia]|eukprot:XP_001444271.1 hypothetical protein (macronuclear) [Paramecium tetraurelia strain d4-2]
MDDIFDNIFKKISAYRMSVASDSKCENEPNQTSSEIKFLWTPKAEEKLKELHVLQQGNWKSISSILNGPSPIECMHKWQQLHPDQTHSRQLWSPQEDEQLKELVQKYGKKWSKICTVMNWRTGKQVRERYLNQLQGTINQDKWTEEEDKLILKLYRKFGTKWSYISSFLNGRPENMVKNRFYANLKRRYQCDLGDSDDDDFERESAISSDDERIILQKRRKLPKSTKDDQKQKKIQVKDANQENLQRMTRSKLIKQNDENSQKLDGSNENENNSGQQNANSLINNQITNIKRENLLKIDHSNINSQFLQQPLPTQTANQEAQIFNNSHIFQQYSNMALLNQSNTKIVTDQNSLLYLQQNKQSQLPFAINQYPGIQMINPILGFVSPQQQYVYQLPCQQNYFDQINYFQKWNEFSSLYNNQLLQSGLQP